MTSYDDRQEDRRNRPGRRLPSITELGTHQMTTTRHMVRQVRRDLIHAGLPHLARKVCRGTWQDWRPRMRGGLCRDDAERINAVQAARWPDDIYALNDAWWAYYLAYDTAEPQAWDTAADIDPPLWVDWARAL